ncbi:MAG: MarR family winged helix-turn-helix transcriptional regulator [Actinomycetes bacterium]
MTHDAPDGARWLSADEQATWRAFLAFVARLDEVLDRQLQRDAGMPHAYYQVLAMLSEAPERTLRMSQLARITLSSPSRLSHAVARLEEKGWVRRDRHPTDRRGALAVLTDEGFSALEAAAPAHVAEVRRALFDRLTPEQVHRMLDTFTALLDEGDAPVGGRHY